MIRGQPRPNAHSTSPTAQPRVVPSQPFPMMQTPGDSPPASGLNTPNPEYSYTGRRRPQTASTMPPPVASHRTSYHGSFQSTGYDPSGGAPSQVYHQPASSYSDPGFSNLDINTFFPGSAVAFDSHSAGLSTPESHSFDFLTMPTTYEPIPHEVPSATGPDALQTQHVLYYFEHVRKMQFVFAGSNLVTNIMYSVRLEFSRLSYRVPF